MRQYIQYVLGCLIFFSLFTQSFYHLIDFDDPIIIEHIELEKDTNEDDHKKKEWEKHVFVINPSQFNTQKQKAISSLCFYMIPFHNDYIHTIITPPPQV